MNFEEVKIDEAKPEAYSSLRSAPVLRNDIELPKNAAQGQSPVRLKRGLKARHSSMVRSSELWQAHRLCTDTDNYSSLYSRSPSAEEWALV